VVSHLNLAAKDSKVKAVILQIDSPGGSVTASDVLYHEIQDFKKRTQAKVLSMMMNLAASGAYYLALASDRIIAHPTTVTGSVGVIFIRPSLEGLMSKIGVKVETTKSGEYKDMGSPFRGATEEEKRLFQKIIEEMEERFVGLVAERRQMGSNRIKMISEGRIYTAGQALELGLIDRIGYLSDAVEETKKMAQLPDDARLVVYRRNRYHNDNPYNMFTEEHGGNSPQIIDLGLSHYLTVPHAGFYYLWAPEFGKEK
jgi:protease-4